MIPVQDPRQKELERRLLFRSRLKALNAEKASMGQLKGSADAFYRASVGGPSPEESPIGTQFPVDATTMAWKGLGESFKGAESAVSGPEVAASHRKMQTIFMGAQDYASDVVASALQPAENLLHGATALMQKTVLGGADLLDWAAQNGIDANPGFRRALVSLLGEPAKAPVDMRQFMHVLDKPETIAAGKAARARLEAALPALKTIAKVLNTGAAAAGFMALGPGQVVGRAGAMIADSLTGLGMTESMAQLAGSIGGFFSESMVRTQGNAEESAKTAAMVPIFLIMGRLGIKTADVLAGKGVPPKIAGSVAGALEGLGFTGLNPSTVEKAIQTWLDFHRMRQELQDAIGRGDDAGVAKISRKLQESAKSLEDLLIEFGGNALGFAALRGGKFDPRLEAVYGIGKEVSKAVEAAKAPLEAPDLAHAAVEEVFDYVNALEHRGEPVPIEYQKWIADLYRKSTGRLDAKAQREAAQEAKRIEIPGEGGPTLEEEREAARIEDKFGKGLPDRRVLEDMARRKGIEGAEDMPIDDLVEALKVPAGKATEKPVEAPEPAPEPEPVPAAEPAAEPKPPEAKPTEPKPAIEPVPEPKPAAPEPAETAATQKRKSVRELYRQAKDLGITSEQAKDQFGKPLSRLTRTELEEVIKTHEERPQESDEAATPEEPQSSVTADIEAQAEELKIVQAEEAEEKAAAEVPPPPSPPREAPEGAKKESRETSGELPSTYNEYVQMWGKVETNDQQNAMWKFTKEGVDRVLEDLDWPNSLTTEERQDIAKAVASDLYRQNISLAVGAGLRESIRDRASEFSASRLRDKADEARREFRKNHKDAPFRDFSTYAQWSNAVESGNAAKAQKLYDSDKRAIKTATEDFEKQEAEKKELEEKKEELPRKDGGPLSGKHGFKKESGLLKLSAANIKRLRKESGFLSDDDKIALIKAGLFDLEQSDFTEKAKALKEEFGAIVDPGVPIDVSELSRALASKSAKVGKPLKSLPAKAFAPLGAVHEAIQSHQRKAIDGPLNMTGVLFDNGMMAATDGKRLIVVRHPSIQNAGLRSSSGEKMGGNFPDVLPFLPKKSVVNKIGTVDTLEGIRLTSGHKVFGGKDWGGRNLAVIQHGGLHLSINGKYLNDTLVAFSKLGVAKVDFYTQGQYSPVVIVEHGAWYDKGVSALIMPIENYDPETALGETVYVRVNDILTDAPKAPKDDAGQRGEVLVSPQEIRNAIKKNIEGAKSVGESLVFNLQKYGTWMSDFLEARYGKIGRHLAESLRLISLKSKAKSSRDLQDAVDVLHGIKDAVVQEAMMRMNERIKPKEIKYGDESRRIMEAIRLILDRAPVEAAEVGIRRGSKGENEGGLIPSVGGKAYPQLPNEAGREFIKRLRKGRVKGQELEKIVDEMVEEGAAKTGEEAEKALRQYAADWQGAKNHYFHSFRGKMPRRFIEWDARKILNGHFYNVWRTIEASRIWGDKLRGLRPIRDKLGQEYNAAEAQDIYSWMLEQFGTRARVSRNEQAFWATGGAWNTLKLSSPFSAIRNNFQALVNSGEYGFWRVMPAYWKLAPFASMWSKNAQDLVKNVERQGLIHSITELTEVEKEAPSLLRGAVSAATVLFRPSETEAQTRGAIIATAGVYRDLATLMQSKAGKQSRFARMLRRLVGMDEAGAMRRLMRHGLSERRINRALEKGEWTQEDVDLFASNFTTDTEFGLSFASKRMLWDRSPFYRLLMKFKPFSIDQFRKVWWTGVTELRHGNAYPMMHVVFFSQLVGELYNDLRDLFEGSERGVLTSLLKGSLDAQGIADRIGRNLAQGGAAGILTDIATGWGDWLVGPVGTSLKHASGAAADIVSNPEITGNIVKNFLSREIPVMRQGERTFDRFLETAPKSERMTIRRQTWRNRLRDLAARDEYPGFSGTVKHQLRQFLQGFGTWRAERTALYSRIAAWLDVNNLDEAAALIAIRMRDAKGLQEATRILDGIKQAVLTSRSPMGPLPRRLWGELAAHYEREDLADLVELQREWRHRGAAAIRKGVRTWTDRVRGR